MRNRRRVSLLTAGLFGLAVLAAFGLNRPLPVSHIARLIAGRPLPWTKLTRSLPARYYPSAKPVEVLTLEANGEHWVDSVYQSLTPAQKVGQFFMVATFSNRHENHYEYVDHLIENYHIGGLIFFQGGPYRQAILTNRYQALSKVPLLIGIDGEWGLGMRLDSAMEFPKQMTLGATANPETVRRMGDEIGRQCQRLGIQINFAPVSDINSNPANPVIGNRSFGENRENVATKAIAYMRGLQGRHVIATAKHFPGHGDANADSHHTLPLISRSSEQLHDIDLYPFRQLIADSLMGVVTGHLHVPGVDNTSPALAATLSEKIVTDLLKRELGFRGLVFTDALNMAGVSRAGRGEDVNLKALQAGNDILLYPENVAQAVRVILDAIQQGKISQALIDDKVRKILRAKYWAGLNHRQPVSLVNLAADLDTPDAHQINADLAEQAVTIVSDPDKLLPIKRLDTLQLASVSIGAETWPVGGETVFQQTISQYAPCVHISLPDKPNTEADLAGVIARIGSANVVLLSYHHMIESSYRRFGVTRTSTDLIGRLRGLGKKVIVTAFGSPYSLPIFAGANAVVCGYQDFAEMQQAAPNVIFGGLGAKGALPVTAGDWRAGTGVQLDPGGRLTPGAPESVGMNPAMLAKIDGLVQAAIRDRVVPGCQVLVARKGKIVYSKNFGGLTYGPTAERVTDNTLYDLASLTKVLSTLQCVMCLYDRKQLDLDQKASFYLPELRGTNKQAITIRDLLWHQSGIISYYPQLWDRTRTAGGSLKPTYYSPVADSLHPLQIAPTLWATAALKDSVWKWVVQSPMSRKLDESGKPAYVYSDLGFLTLQKVVERIAKQPLDKFVTTQIYRPLGLSLIGFTPLQRLTNPHCAPTEQDNYFRNSLLVGTVHDQMAAVQGGISGHAGLFGNANDVARVLQMNLQNGDYGGHKCFSTSTLPYFAQTISPRSYRALGWDKPNPTDNSVYLADAASSRSFGHTGFTGNMVWVDPDKELVFVFLSNRIHPTAANTLINTTKLRRRIDELIYAAIQ